LILYFSSVNCQLITNLSSHGLFLIKGGYKDRTGEKK
jgi:hypothetical protein